MTTIDTTQLCLTDRQISILGIALTDLYDEIAMGGEGKKMRDDIMELSKYIQKQYQYYHD
jgi:hypothetical protein